MALMAINEKLRPYHLIYEEKEFLRYVKNGIIVDSCVLLELIKWFNNINIPEEEKEAFKQIERFLSLQCTKYITPHIIAELSNLINKEIAHTGTDGFSNCIELIKIKLTEEEGYKEKSIYKDDVLELNESKKLGITDAGIILLSKEDNKIILTKDSVLDEECKYKQNLPCLNLDDIKSLVLTLQCFKK